jgi:molecular chaperone HtpG
MIMDHAKDLLPAWMRNIVGIVETPDLPLNVSREILQQSTIMFKIQTSLIKEVLKSLHYIHRTQPNDYMSYFNGFGRLLKEGVYYETEKREDIASLLYFASKNHEHISLDTYITENTEALL